YASVDISERTLREVHLPPFEAAVKARVASIMPAFTDLAGVPMTAHRELLRDHLRGRLGFEGVLISDYNAIAELLRHGVAEDLARAAALALRAGIDIDMMSDAYRRGLPEALRRGWVRMAEVDVAVRRVLGLKAELGLFADPYARGARRESAAALERRRRFAREVGARAVVLLKNDADVLPLPVKLERIALIGPLADAAGEMRGPWWAAAGTDDQVTLLQGVRAAWPRAKVLHTPGAGIRDREPAGIETAVALCDEAEVILLGVGEAANMSGEAASRTDLDLPGAQRELARAVLDRAARLGKPVVTVLFSGRPLAVPWLVEASQAVLAAWFPGSEAGHALADLLIGKRSPSGRTPVSWPRHVGQVPVFFAQRPSGRPANPVDGFTSKYLDAPNEPLFSFGHG
ncbi:MAG: glycoside hydrolase family 3 C-terminal domain-containing protein, partial [Proteobacteria bacterium]|nr:glycoside hydrolase family 3 C-terminal domain-containing protein [Pseudomonadota bacterium]